MNKLGRSHEMILAVSIPQPTTIFGSSYRGRFAPSPTGPLHLGSLATALGSWLDARAHQGKWLLRIEDVDVPRSLPGATATILHQLSACGLQWDEEVIYQSQRTPNYESALLQLFQAGLIYPCTCSRQAIVNALAAQGTYPGRHEELIYPRICRPTPIPHALANSEFVNLAHPVAWRIALQSEELNQSIGDFVLRRADGFFTYQMAVVVDDAAQNITHIVRGADLASNTARQIYLQSALGYPTPHYLHLPLVLDQRGDKLSKQTMATAIATDNAQLTLQALQLAAGHLGLTSLPNKDHVTIAEWLLAATQAWREQKI
jgi:glutamyl-Q tRNA(Asp) synthetase